jgi:uncharacterized membrane protein
VNRPVHQRDARHESRAIRRFRARVWLASSMWAPVLAANLVAIGLGVALPLLDAEIHDRPTLPIALSAVEQILGSLAAGMITFTGIVFSAVFVAAQIQTSAYSPRLAARLRRDPVIIAGLALPTATASYALFALATIGEQTDRQGTHVAPALTVGLALVLTFVTFASFVALVQRAFDSIQIGGILRTLMHRARQVIEDVHPEGGPARREARDAAVDVGHSEWRYEGPPAVLAAIDRAALIRLAGETDAFVEVVPMIGEYISSGTVVLRMHGAVAEPRSRSARRALVLARQRTLDQDPGFALRMLVDVAIRALSSAINDPTTAVQAIDRIEDLLVDLHRRRPGPSVVIDDDGAERGLVPAPTWEEYLDLALVEIRHYGAGSPQVARRLRALHDHLLEVVDEPDRERVMLERRLLDEALGRSFPDSQERAMLSRPDRLGLGSAP